MTPYIILTAIVGGAFLVMLGIVWALSKIDNVVVKIWR
jgi:hypothetical protein